MGRPNSSASTGKKGAGVRALTTWALAQGAGEAPVSGASPRRWLGGWGRWATRGGRLAQAWLGRAGQLGRGGAADRPRLTSPDGSSRSLPGSWQRRWLAPPRELVGRGGAEMAGATGPGRGLPDLETGVDAGVVSRARRGWPSR